jgi:hypothetical protein
MIVGASVAQAESHPFLSSFGSFTNPNGIAIDESTGDVYVADTGVDAQQTVSLEGGPTGSFTLEFEGQKTSALSVGSEPPSAETVETALDALTKIGAGNVSVTQSGSLPETVAYTISFRGALATKSMPQLVCDSTALTGGTSPACKVATTTQGVRGSVSMFDANGTPANFFALGGNQLTGASTPAGSFSFPASIYGTPAAIAVDNSKSPSDPSAGDLYVMDAGHGVVDKFSSSGEYLNQITGFAPATGSSVHELLGLAVDANGIVRIDLKRPSPEEVGVDEFDDSSTNRLIAEQVNSAATEHAIGVPEEPSADGFAVGPTGDDYLLYEACSCSAKFGQQLAGFGALDDANAGDVALAVDPATGSVYADDQSSVAEWDTAAMNGDKPPISGSAEVEDSDELVSRFGSSQLSGSSGQGGIAVNGSSGDIYVSNPADGKVYIFGSDAPVTADAATNITKETATLSGTFNPRGTPVTLCQFEYGVANEFGQVTNNTYEHRLSCTREAAAAGSGSMPDTVYATIDGLEPGLLYRFRFITANTSGQSESSGLLATPGVGFGIKSFEVSFLNEDGTPDTQAGSHPYELVNNIEFNSRFLRTESNADSPYVREPDGTLKNLAVDLPSGLVGDPNATSKKCTLNQLDEFHRGAAGGCPEEAFLGRLQLEFSNQTTDGTYSEAFKEPVYNMVPPRGVALQLGVNYIYPNLFINNGLLTGGDYPIQATITNAPPAAPVFDSRLTIFGRAGKEALRKREEALHHEPPELLTDEERAANLKPFLTLPTGCHGPLRSTISVESYQGARADSNTVTHNSAGTPVTLTGCSKLQFPPTISVVPDTGDASTSSGLTVGVHISQKAASNPEGLAESSLRDTTVTLPEGMALNPAGADGLEACSENLAGFTGFNEFNQEDEPGVETATFTPEMPSPVQPGTNFCPDGSKIGTVKIKTPLLEHELEGAVYLASQNANPFGSLVAMYMMVEDPASGSLVKLTGEVKLSATGQIVTTFENTPDLPFEELQLHFFGGERAPLTTPSRCGTYTTQASFVPWDGNGPVNTSSSFQITSGPNGSPCPGANLPFNPSLTAGTTNNQAGGLSPFTMTMSRADGSQSLQSVSLKLPPGLSGLLTGVELCGEAQADAGTCGPNSEIGETTVSVGVGNDPFSVKGGKVYLTGPYKGAPFGLSIVNPAVAGPYNLGQVIVRAKIEVNPITSDLTITSDNEGPYKIPTILDGIPLEIQHVNVTVNRQGFTFNPTNCNPMSITGSLDSAEGATAVLSVPFQATNCASLSFKPQFSVSTSAKTSRKDGASLHVKLVYPKLPFGSQANIASVKVDLPKQLPSRLTTLQKACLASVFNANPAACPADSRVGTARATTPLLPVPLNGPAYFVSNGGAKFPELVIVLTGYGVTVDLHSETFISKAGITSSTFRTIPDVPVGTFELTLPQKPFSALAANGNLCTPKKTVLVKHKVKITVKGHTKTVTRKVRETLPSSLQMPTAFTAQNGATIHESTPISVTGCASAKKAKKKTRKTK